MASFNFGNVNKPVSNGSTLRAWNIYDNCEFAGISEPVTGVGKTSGSNWKAWDITFHTPQGDYRERIFEPNERSAERMEVAGANGGKIELPSEIERVNEIFRQIVSTYATPENKEKLNKLAESGKLNNIDFETFVSVMKAVLKDPIKPSPEHPIQIKLQGRKGDRGTFARLPNARISTQPGSEGEVWMERFLGSNLSLSSYELQQQKAMGEGVPTTMPDIDNNDANVDDLLADL